ncbi:ANTAR domain-containing protein [Salinicola corii]|uniref:ANTAR domain-containing protein n=1 Tax=Salinicola corii TaxID=2606937 RepID=A0A640WDT3_9GAMM|nr:ANTAR domain-containing protein [Salinicola corii]KAA0018128.1 ANTAR domain-containing protein [Salinicola corii]
MNSHVLSPHLLLVDCEARSLAMLLKSLDRLGLRSETVYLDSPAALDNVSGVIVELDHFNSDRLLARVRGAGIPIIAMTHHQTLSQIQRAISLGATAILNKPITQSMVYTTLAMAKELRQQTQSLETANHELARRLESQGVVSRAVARLMVTLSCDETQAYERLRSHAMEQQLTLGHAAERLLQTDSERWRQRGHS